MISATGTRRHPSKIGVGLAGIEPATHGLGMCGGPSIALFSAPSRCIAPGKSTSGVHYVAWRQIAIVVGLWCWQRLLNEGE